MAMTGFDPEKVTGSISRVKDAYNELENVLKGQVESQFVGGMGSCWASNDAIKFFTGSFKPAEDGIISDANNVFQSVVEAMNSAAENWAQQTESSYSAQTFGATAQKIDVSAIQENIGGVRGVDEAQAKTVAGKLVAIADQAEAALSKAQSAVSDCGFVGRGQAESLNNSLNTIKTKITNIFKEMTNEVKNSIEKTADAYGDLGTNASSAFGG